jgi:hypothetical protein
MFVNKKNMRDIEVYKKGIGYQYAINFIGVSIPLLFILLTSDSTYRYKVLLYLVIFAIFLVLTVTPIKWKFFKKRCERIILDQKQKEGESVDN